MWERVIPLILTMTDTLCNLQHENDQFLKLLRKKKTASCEENIFFKYAQR